MHKVREVLRRYCAGDSAFAQANDQAGRAEAEGRVEADSTSHTQSGASVA